MAADVAQRVTFFPAGTGAFVRRRLAEAAGLALAVAALWLAAALVTFDAGDPSLNVATGREPANLMGAKGALAADLAFQAVGYAAGLLVVLPLAWAWRLVAAHKLSRPRLRVAMLGLALAAGAAALGVLSQATLPAPVAADADGAGAAAGTPDAGAWLAQGWLGAGAAGAGAGGPVVGAPLLEGPLAVGAGGLAGKMMAGPLMNLVPLPAWAWLPFAAGAGLVALAAAGFGLGLTAGEWLGMGRAARWSARQAWRGLGIGGRGLGAGAGLAAAFAADRWDRMAGAARVRREPHLGGLGGEADAFDEDVAAREGAAREGRARGAAAEGAGQGDAFDAGEDEEDTRPAPPIAAREPEPRAKRPKARQVALELEPQGDYQLPPLDLLAKPKGRATLLTEAQLAENARKLESVLADFGIKGQIVQVRPGPVVTLYELEPEAGIRSSRVIGLADDIARLMSAVSARVAVIPGRNAIGIELPNAERDVVALRDLLASPDYEATASELTLTLGKDIGGRPVIVDLARMPHLLVAGTTGSGKSVALNSMILSLLYRLPPDRCKFIMIDPKMLELSVYDGIPHLLAPVVTEPRKAVVALKWTVREMENRYRLMSKVGVRNVAGFNKRLAEATAKGEALMRTVQTGFDAETGAPIFEDEVLANEPLPLIVVIVDEMADLMLLARQDIEVAIQRLAQMARAAGIHLIMATQRPSVDVITGTIKANFPSRVSFQVTSKIDSRTILGEQGAEQLLGQGDMLYMAGSGRITRVHGPFVSEGDVEKVVAYLKRQAAPDYVAEVTEDPEGEGDEGMFGEGEGGGTGDQLYDQAVALVIREGKASTSFVQRHLMIGYNRAARLIERMENEGVVSRANHVGKREVLAGRG